MLICTASIVLWYFLVIIFILCDYFILFIYFFYSPGASLSAPQTRRRPSWTARTPPGNGGRTRKGVPSAGRRDTTSARRDYFILKGFFSCPNKTHFHPLRGGTLWKSLMGLWFSLLFLPLYLQIRVGQYLWMNVFSIIFSYSLTGITAVQTFFR